MQCLAPREESLLLVAIPVIREEYKSLLLTMFALVQFGKPRILALFLLRHPIDVYPFLLLGLFLLLQAVRLGSQSGVPPGEVG